MATTMRVGWHGVFTALVTPFKDDGSLDEAGLTTLVKRQVDAGVHGLVPCGTTGESPALSTEEWTRVIEITVSEANGRAFVVAGTGTNNTPASQERTKRAADLGVDGALVITPYYNKPSPSGIVNHFRQVAAAAPDLPIMVYNVPGRTGINLVPDTLGELLQIPNIAAVKEASGNLAQIWENGARYGDRITVLSGDDGLNLPILELGGVGCVSVLSNVVPELVVEQYQAHVDGKRARARELHWLLAGLASGLFVENSPAPTKYALSRLGLPAGAVRAPLGQLSDAGQQRVLADMRGLGLKLES